MGLKGGDYLLSRKLRARLSGEASLGLRPELVRGRVYLSGMTMAQLKLALIEKIVATSDDLVLRTVYEVLATEATGGLDAPLVHEEPAGYQARADVGDRADAGVGLVADDAVLGTRPDGTPIRAGEAVRDWDADVAAVLAGGGVSAEEVVQKWSRRAR